MARSEPRPPFGLLKVTVAGRSSRLSHRKAERREYFRQFRSHLENPGSKPFKRSLIVFGNCVRIYRAHPAARPHLAGVGS